MAESLDDHLAVKEAIRSARALVGKKGIDTRPKAIEDVVETLKETGIAQQVLFDFRNEAGYLRTKYTDHPDSIRALLDCLTETQNKVCRRLSKEELV